MIIIFLSERILIAESDDFTIAEAYEMYKELNFRIDPVNLFIYCKKMVGSFN